MVFRVQQEKEVSQEILQVSQIVQNFADRNSIDYEKYAELDLTSTQGITDILYLSGLDGEVVIYSSGECIDPWVEYTYKSSWSDCSLYLDIWGETKELINMKKVILTRPIFKIIPFASEQQYLNSDSLCEEGKYLYCLNAPGFRMIFTAYSANYGTQRATHVTVPFQQFF